MTKPQKKATITSVGDFVAKCKNARKNVSAFDELNLTQAENYVFGTNYSNGDYAKHFDNYVVNLLKEKKMNIRKRGLGRELSK
jgi:hypothetical protein